MKPASLALRALPFTFVIYVIEAVLATFVALPSGLEIAGQLRTSSWDRAQWALLLDRLPALLAAMRMSGFAALVLLGVLLVLSAWLQMSWLASLDELMTPLRALARGARLIVRAWLVSLLVVALLLLLCLPFGLMAYSVHSGLAGSTDARFHDLALASALVPLLPLWLFGHTLHDLARARALYRGALDGVVQGFRHALRPRVLLRSLSLWALGTGLVLLAHALAYLTGGAFRFVITVVLVQSALLARLVVRSVWLARALTCVLPDRGPLAAPSSEASND